MFNSLPKSCSWIIMVHQGWWFTNVLVILLYIYLSKLILKNKYYENWGKYIYIYLLKRLLPVKPPPTAKILWGGNFFLSSSFLKCFDGRLRSLWIAKVTSKTSFFQKILRPIWMRHVIWEPFYLWLFRQRVNISNKIDARLLY